MRRPWLATARLLARACHPEPTLAVTVVTALLAVRAGAPLGIAVLVVAAVFTGQLSIGWSNDRLDARRDRSVGRRDKPVAEGALDPRVIEAAIGAAVAACVVLSLLCGWRSGLTHLVLGVGSGWVYNLVLKRTVWSWAPYAVAFGTLPAVVYLAVDASRLPPVWLMAAGALLGVGAHLANTLPDLADDLATGVRGLPHRLGARLCGRIAACLMVAASIVIAWGPASRPPLWCLAAVVVAAVVVALGLRRARLAFHAVVAAAAIDVVMFTVR